jgi:predicted nucleic acid binding AN1-type Zn finger protein
MPEIPTGPPPKQADHSRCFKCSKKVGLLGYRCKVCDCSYCNGHRLPEDHTCDGNYVENAKTDMKKNNISVAAPKIQKID